MGESKSKYQHAPACAKRGREATQFPQRAESPIHASHEKRRRGPRKKGVLFLSVWIHHIPGPGPDPEPQQPLPFLDCLIKIQQGWWSEWVCRIADSVLINNVTLHALRPLTTRTVHTTSPCPCTLAATLSSGDPCLCIRPFLSCKYILLPYPPRPFHRWSMMESCFLPPAAFSCYGSPDISPCLTIASKPSVLRGRKGIQSCYCHHSHLTKSPLSLCYLQSALPAS